MISTRLLLEHSIVNCLTISSVILTDRRTDRQNCYITVMLCVGALCWCTAITSCKQSEKQYVTIRAVVYSHYKLQYMVL